MNNSNRRSDASAQRSQKFAKNTGIRRHRMAAHVVEGESSHAISKVLVVAERFLQVGTVVRVDVPFREGDRSKVRPAVVTGRVGRRVHVMPITTSPRAQFAGDLAVSDLATAGLHRPSTVRTLRIAEVDRSAVIEVLGVLGSDDQVRVFGFEVA